MLLRSVTVPEPPPPPVTYVTNIYKMSIVSVSDGQHEELEKRWDWTEGKFDDLAQLYQLPEDKLL